MEQWLTPGEVGELWMRGPHVCGGYWANPDESGRTIRDGWLCTGDLMKQDEDGYFFVIGRKKEMFISGGENVYPAQVERVLQSHESVAVGRRDRSSPSEMGGDWMGVLPTSRTSCGDRRPNS
jgi:acyl-CoA synthetase (AMP-forming)/AMP-acid ligase II